MLSLALLGPCQVTIAGQPLTNFPTRRALALLIYLASQPAQPQRREILMELLWPGMPPASAQTNLRQAIYQLRRVLGHADAGVASCVAADRQAVWLESGADVETDVARFRRYTGGDTAAWRQAVALYRGDFLQDFYLPDSEPFEAWAAAERADLRRSLQELLIKLTAAGIEQAQWQAAEGDARRHLALDDLNEVAQRQLVEILARSGRRSEAFAQIQRFRELLATELGVTPAAELEALAAALTRGELTAPAQPLAAVTAVSAATLSQSPHNLHAPTTPLIGRERELGDLDQMLRHAHTRLLTLVGPGGIGKSRLALAFAGQVVQRAAARFPDGVFFVTLAPVANVGQMVAAIADAIGLHLESGHDRQARRTAGRSRPPREQLLDYLRHKHMLLVLDNCEHLLESDAGDEDAAGLAAALLQSAPGLVIVATSRTRLQLQEEQLLLLQGMAAPQSSTDSNFADFAAVQLFVQRARQVQPAFVLTDADAEHLVHICRQVEGMPLALELAASWADALPVAGIAAEMARSLDFLESDLRNLPPRHRSIRAIFDRSWQQLTNVEQEILAKLAVFCGGFTREAAGAITNVTLRQLATFVNKSLIHYQPSQDRYHLHELLRQYGAERLAADPAAADAAHIAHAGYFCAFVETCFPQLKDRRQPAAMKALEQNLGNVLTAWEWAVAQGDVTLLLRLTPGIMLFFTFSGRSDDGVATFSAALARIRALATPERLATDGDLVRLLAQLLCALAYVNPNIEATQPLLRESLALLKSTALAGQDVRTVEALADYLLGESLHAFGYALAVAPYEAALAHFRALDDAWGMTLTLNSLGWLAWTHGDYAHGRHFAQDAIAWNQTLGNRQQAIDSRLLLAHLELWLGETSAAETHLAQVVETTQHAEASSIFATGLSQLTTLSTLRGDYPAAAEYAARTVTLAREHGHLPSEAHYNVTLALQWIHLGDYHQAQHLIEQSLHYYHSTIQQAHHMVGLSYLGLGMAALGLLDYAEAMRQLNLALADQRTTDRPSDVAGSLAYLGRAQLARDEVEEAAASLREAVVTARATRSIIPMLEALPPLTHLAQRIGNGAESRRLLALAARFPLLTRSRLHRSLLDAVAAQHGEDVSAVAASAGAPEAGALWALADELLDRFFAGLG